MGWHFDRLNAQKLRWLSLSKPPFNTTPTFCRGRVGVHLVVTTDKGGSDDLATVKYLTLSSYSSNSSKVTPDWKAEVSNTSLVTASDLTWTLDSQLTHSQWDVKLNNNGVAEATLEEQTTGAFKYDATSHNAFASVSFTITALKDIKLKKISAITSGGKSPTGITCYVDDVSKATGVQYSSSTTKAWKLAEADLGDIEIAKGKKATIKITSDKNADATDGAKIDFGQISLLVMNATASEVPVTGVTVSSADNVTELEKGASTTLTATVTPGNATSKTVTWSITAADGTSATTAATVENGKVTAGTVEEDTVVKVFATAGGVKSEPYSITIKAPEALAAGTFSVNILNYSGTDASKDTASITNADNDIVTISDVAFALDSTSNDKRLGIASQTVGAMDSKTKTAAGLTENQYGYLITTENDSIKNSSKIYGGAALGALTFTVTPKSGKTVSLKGVSGYTRYAGSGAYTVKITTSDSATVDMAGTATSGDNATKNVATVASAVTQTATGSAFTVTISLVSNTDSTENSGSTQIKSNQKIEFFNFDLVFTDETAE